MTDASAAATTYGYDTYGNRTTVTVTGGDLTEARTTTIAYDTQHGRFPVSITNALNHKVKEAYVDMGYRGHNHQGAEIIHVDKRRRGNTGRRLWKRMKHRAAVEPTIGHCKNEHRMERNRLHGEMGDAINALLSAASMNFGKLLAAFLRFIIGLMLGSYRRPSSPCLSPGSALAA